MGDFSFTSPSRVHLKAPQRYPSLISLIAWSCFKWHFVSFHLAFVSYPTLNHLFSLSKFPWNAFDLQLFCIYLRSQVLNNKVQLLKTQACRVTSSPFPLPYSLPRGWHCCRRVVWPLRGGRGGGGFSLHLRAEIDA